MQALMAEHVPNKYLVALMAAFFGAMALAALLFWGASILWPGGVNGLMGALGSMTVAIFGTLHIPAAIVGILLLQWDKRRMPPKLRVATEAATLYFGLMVVISIALNYFAASLLDFLT